FLGKQNGVQAKLSQADLFLLPSQLESFGLAALEAMACEVPVIATNVGGVPEVVEHGVDGYLVEPGDVKLAGKYAIDLLSRADRGREVGQLARVHAKKKFCANDVIPKYECYYEQVLAQQRSTARASPCVFLPPPFYVPKPPAMDLMNDLIRPQSPVHPRPHAILVCRPSIEPRP